MGTRGKSNDQPTQGNPNDGQSNTIGGGNTGGHRKPEDDKKDGK